jgi:hypothetical protein
VEAVVDCGTTEPRRRYRERRVLGRGERLQLVTFPDLTIAVDDLLPPRVLD